MSDSCSSDSGAARDMNHVLEYKGMDVSSLLSEREKRQRKKTSSKFLADIDVGLSCVEFVSAHTCPKCKYYVDEYNDYAYLFTISSFGRCQDPVEPHYVAELELKCKNCALNPAILDHMTWTVTMWHFGADALITYEGEKIYTSWEVGQHALITAYSKDWKDGKRRIRIEKQEYPKKSLADALEEKLNTNSSVVEA